MFSFSDLTPADLAAAELEDLSTHELLTLLRLLDDLENAGISLEEIISSGGRNRPPHEHRCMGCNITWAHDTKGLTGKEYEVAHRCPACGQKCQKVERYLSTAEFAPAGTY